MKHTHIAGVDPGLVHTGVVGIEFDSLRRRIYIEHEVVLGCDGQAVAAWLYDHHMPKDTVWIEAFRDRGNLNSNSKMHAGVADIRSHTAGKVLDNTGIKTVITNDLLRLLGCWNFSTPTHHQDLRSAARIALLGYVKTDDGNGIVADVVADHLAGRTWQPVHR